MRILSARVLRARRLRDTAEVGATVLLLTLAEGAARPSVAEVEVRVPARAIGAAPLRDRLLGLAKLAHAMRHPIRRAA